MAKAKDAATVEVGGVEVSVDPSIKDDMRFLTYLTAIMQADDPMESAGYMNRLLAMIFGDIGKAVEAMDAIADAHGGSCSYQDFLSWLTEAMEASGAKN